MDQPPFSHTFPQYSAVGERGFSLPSQLDVFCFFQGETLAYGIFEDRFGKLRRSFRVYIQGETEDDRLRLTEDFYYADGEESQRIWLITDEGDNRFAGTAADIQGQAEGVRQQHMLSWRYSMDLLVHGRRWRVDFDDRMYLLDEKIMVNRARVSKWGMTLGTVSIFFCKP
ncbi:DUF3833 family protein [Aliamphritea hakodatensis]|uniref:DUF3833 family protein n=1 Tax=Aliamphritea hakodatensis TaxID=2895352 RepID=UPI0022FD553B|nr:DUF3833 family protein [Aliamphritea hakodatensis]